MTDQELRAKYYSMLAQFSHGSAVAKSRLLRLEYSDNDISFAVSNHLIRELARDDRGMPIYGITSFGRNIRDN